DTLTRPLSLARERRPLGRVVRCSRNDSSCSGRFAGSHRSFDFLLRAVFRSGDGALLTQVTSITPSRSQSSRPHQIHTTFPTKSSSSSQRPASGRRTRECSAGNIVPFLPVGGPTGRTHSAVARWNCDLRRRSPAL